MANRRIACAADAEPTPDRKTPEEIFKAAWHEADERGEKGSRVAAGIAALRAAGLLVAAPTEEQIGASYVRLIRRLIEQLRKDAGEYALILRGDDAPHELSWDQRNVRAWDAATALEALLDRAAGVAPQEPSAVVDDAADEQDNPDLHMTAPSPDRERLIANAEDWLRNGSPLGPRRIIRSLIDALAAQPVLDREKVRQTVMNALPYTVEVSEPDGPAMYAHRTSRGAWQESGPIADAICEAAKRGELT